MRKSPEQPNLDVQKLTPEPKNDEVKKELARRTNFDSALHSYSNPGHAFDSLALDKPTQYKNLKMMFEIAKTPSELIELFMAANGFPYIRGWRSSNMVAKDPLIAKKCLEKLAKYEMEKTEWLRLFKELGNHIFDEDATPLYELFKKKTGDKDL